jgi:hypothetical protein
MVRAMMMVGGIVFRLRISLGVKLIALYAGTTTVKMLFGQHPDVSPFMFANEKNNEGLRITKIS